MPKTQEELKSIEAIASHSSPDAKVIFHAVDNFYREEVEHLEGVLLAIAKFAHSSRVSHYRAGLGSEASRAAYILIEIEDMIRAALYPPKEQS